MNIQYHSLETPSKVTFPVIDHNAMTNPKK